VEEAVQVMKLFCYELMDQGSSNGAPVAALFQANMDDVISILTVRSDEVWEHITCRGLCSCVWRVLPLLTPLHLEQQRALFGHKGDLVHIFGIGHCALGIRWCQSLSDARLLRYMRKSC